MHDPGCATSLQCGLLENVGGGAGHEDLTVSLAKHVIPVLLLATLLLASPAVAQQPGWHYSPLPGEGDRAAMGCGYGADATEYTCIAVRCEDDFSVGVHIHTSREGGDAGRWRLDLDKESLEVTAVANSSPYGARIEGDVTYLLNALKQGAVLYLEPLAGPPVSRNGITLEGSLYAINQALYFCAPKVTEPAEPQATR